MIDDHRLRYLRRVSALALVACVGSLAPAGATAQPKAPADESALGVLPVTGRQAEHVTKLAVLPSLSAYQPDVVTRSVVRRDLELTGLFKVVDDGKAPPGLYGFDDAVDIKAWRAIGAEVIVKVAAQKHSSGDVDVHGVAYFVSVGKKPVFQTSLRVKAKDVRITAHRITDALLGAVTGTPGGFASHFAYASRWGSRAVVLTMDSDGHQPKRRTDSSVSSTSPAWGPDGELYFSQSKNYAPYHLRGIDRGPVKGLKTPGTGSVYATAFDEKYQNMAVAVADELGTSVYRAKVTKTKPLEVGAWKKVSTTPIATQPTWSTEGHLAWIGGNPAKWSGQQVFVDGKAVSPRGFSASSPVFCATEDGVRLIYAVSVGSGRRDLVMSNAKGQGMTRLTQGMGNNTSPACSPDGRLLAFFSTRKLHRGQKVSRGLYLMSLKRWVTQRVSGQYGSRLTWAALPPPAASSKAN